MSLYYFFKNWVFNNIMALIFCLVTVGLYWVLCVPLGYDMKSIVQMLPFPDDTLLQVLAIAYFIIVKPHVEEWFWRVYNYEIFGVYEFDFWLVCFCWALTYTVIAINIGASILWALIICLLFMALGRFLVWMRWQHGHFANYVTHMGICAGVVVCYFLADSGKW